MIANDTLRSAIERSYEAFAWEPRPIRLRASPLRDADAILRTLTSAPLRDLGARAIGPYSGWAITTVGSECEYRHFLPRILELAACDGTWLGAEPAVIAGKLKMGRWEDWGVEQREAVLAVFEAGFCASLDAEPGEGLAVADWLCGLAALGRPLEPWLTLWAGSISSNGALQLAYFMRSEEWPLDPTKGVSVGFWEGVSPTGRRQVAEWLMGAPVRQMLERALIQVEPADRWEIEQGLLDLDRAGD